MSSRRSSSPSRVKAQLATATPKVVFLNESLNPECDAARELLGVLTSDEDATSRSNGRGIQMISNASSRCATELRSEGSWMMDVARPLLDLAIDELPLESWSVQTELANAKYLPRFANGTFSPKFDLVVGLPTEPWKAEYEQAGIDIFDRDLSHVDHPHTGKRILGLGMKVKAYGGNLIEAQVELAAWMAGLVSWGFASRCEPSESAEDASALPPPIVGCTFYIVYGIAGPSNQLSEVRIWGPLSDLSGQATSEKHTTALADTLRRVMQYIQGSYAEQLFSLITPRQDLSHEDQEGES
ncbi:hypothetical protein BO94DRAFT_565484 [Aspergillus sclerotioniger CBS 115572]|uniref:PD-(D/E)XK nuclease-like domain-containing protein n=1 Tax=Aspergillus sclerotioniger CBS 115572 TaxID=1450535 RepID=A0A317WSA6_9EURO|nr:hypothetical protein BO94DRAFT_565484 [Aspergillus sclerotioniger CBS 115572]PWY88611.1 hypothetical protein BO94DRAFT_565484 [Aspergillus sclerotioniger CBS 115572]